VTTQLSTLATCDSCTFDDQLALCDTCNHLWCTRCTGRPPTTVAGKSCCPTHAAQPSPPTREGIWGIRQVAPTGELTGGRTVGLGWDSYEEAEAANPPRYGYTYQPYRRWTP
jgi:hypothetical protein